MGKIVVLLVMLAGVAKTAQSQSEKELLIKGNELYKNQQYDKAAAQYQKATALNEKNAKAQYNLGNALFRAKKNGEAEKAFDAAADNAKDATAKSKALYNRGVALTQEKKLAESVQAYEDALKLNPKDNDARENLQKVLNELKKQPPPKQDQNKQNQNNKKNDNNNKDKNQSPQNKSNLNQKQAERMLNALRQQEKKLQQDQQKKMNSNTSQEKDW